MKKIAIAMGVTALVATVSQAEIFVGVDMINGDSMTYSIENDYYSETVEAKSDISGYKIKLGVGDPKSSTFDIYYASLEDDYDTEISEFGINGRPYFNIANNFRLYGQLGLGFGQMDLEGGYYSEDSRSYLNLHGGVGVSYLFADRVELNLGYDYKVQVWQDIEYSSFYAESMTESMTATGGGVYFGVSYYFGDVGTTYTKAAPIEVPATSYEVPVKEEPKKGLSFE